MAYQRLALIPGDCLFPDHSALKPDQHTLFFMAEDSGLCQHFQYHKQKLVLFLSGMRHHADALAENYALDYHRLTAKNFEESYEQKLDATLARNQEIKEVVTYPIEDLFFEKRMEDWCRKNQLKLSYAPTSKFLFDRRDFEQYLEGSKKPFMQVYYKRQRKALQVLVDDEGNPFYDKWSFDEDNRKKLPKNIEIPPQPQSSLQQHDEEVIKLVEQLFRDHPGTTENFNWATTRREALARLDDFLKNRFENFGPYEDAIHNEEVFAFHSVLSPYLNMGLITPREILDRVLEHWQQAKTHYASVEGYVRQIIGWREFLRGMYHNYNMEGNHFGHSRKLKDCWYDGTTGIPPVDDTIRKAWQYGYTHHIERLMVIGNVMLMSGIDPKEVYRWFMEMYVDSADWVMVPNVYGMSQFADGGIFATKPYVAGSNYIRKMSNYSKGDWCDIMDGLYWNFIDQHRETFAKNQRMNMMLATLRKMKPERKEYLFKRAEKWIEKVSY